MRFLLAERDTLQVNRSFLHRNLIMAHKKAGGSTRNGRDSNPQYRGVKLYGGQFAKAGAIIVRQCGTKFHPGFNVGMGKDYTIFAKIDGTVSFRGKKIDILVN